MSENVARGIRVARPAVMIDQGTDARTTAITYDRWPVNDDGIVAGAL